MKKKFILLLFFLALLLANADGGGKALGQLAVIIMGVLYLGTAISLCFFIKLFDKRVKSAKTIALMLSVACGFFGLLIYLAGTPTPDSYPEDDKEVRNAGLSVLIPNILIIALAPWIKTKETHQEIPIE